MSYSFSAVPGLTGRDFPGRFAQGWIV